VWCKKIRGKLHYFGPWDDPDGAPDNYLSQKDALHAGRKPREAAEGTTLKEVCNAFLNAKKAAVDSHELSPRTFDGYRTACGFMIDLFGTGTAGSARGTAEADIRLRLGSGRSRAPAGGGTGGVGARRGSRCGSPGISLSWKR
jgi:hypothetical protein